MVRSAFASFAALLALTSLPASAASAVCGPRADLADNLLTRYDERPVSMGTDTRGGVVEIFAAPAGNWTILLTQPTGLSCLLASGQGWETLPLATAKADVKS